MDIDSQLSLPELTPRQIVAGTLIVVLVGLAFWLLIRFHQVLLIFIAAVIISTAMKPMVSKLHGRGLPRWLGVILVFALLLILIAVISWLLVPLSIDQGQAFLRSLPERYGELREAMLSSPNYFIWRLGFELPEGLELMMTPAADGQEQDPENVIQNLQFAGLVAKTVFAIVAVLVLAFLWTLNGERVVKVLTLLLPAEKRQPVRQFVVDAERMVGAFLVGQALLCLIVGAMALAAFLLLGLPNAFLLALVVGLLEAVPLLGPIIGAIPATLVAYSISPARALVALLAMAIIQQLENQLLVPRVMKRSLGINPVVTLLALMAFTLLFGLPGALVAVPTAALLQLFLNRTVLAAPEPSRQTLDGRDEFSVLRLEAQELVVDLQQHARHKRDDANPDNDFVEDELEAIAGDLERLLAGQAGEGTYS